MRNIIIVLLIFISVGTQAQNKAIRLRNQDNKTLLKKDTIVFDEMLTDSTLSGIMGKYEYRGSGKVYWVDGVRNNSKKLVYFFTRKTIIDSKRF